MRKYYKESLYWFQIRSIYNLYTFDMDKDKYHSRTMMILHFHTGCYINVHLYQKQIVIFTGLLGNKFILLWLLQYTCQHCIFWLGSTLTWNHKYLIIHTNYFVVTFHSVTYLCDFLLSSNINACLLNEFVQLLLILIITKHHRTIVHTNGITAVR